MFLLRDHSGQDFADRSREDWDRSAIGSDSVQIKTRVSKVFDHASLGNPIAQCFSRQPTKTKLNTLPDDPAQMFETLDGDRFGSAPNLKTVF
jgi:hypothetical protein